MTKRIFIQLLFLLVALQVHGQNLQPTRIRVNNLEINYIEQGKGEPFILLHGGMGDYRSWEAQMIFFAQKFRVISYSRRYSYPNQNIPDAKNYSPYYDDADDLAGFLRQLKIKRANLVGTSAGAFTALIFALKYPKMVDSLVLAEPPVHQLIRDTPNGEKAYQEFLTAMWKPLVDAFGKNDDRQAMNIFYKGMSGRNLDSLPPAGVEAVMQSAPAMKAQAMSSDPFPKLSKDKIKKLKTPTLIITGEKTLEIHKFDNQELLRLIPNAEHTTIPNAGHGSAKENPEAFNDAVMSFLENLNKVSAGNYSTLKDSLTQPLRLINKH